MNTRYLFEQFEESKAEGLKAYREKRFDEARVKLLESAEYLYQLASRSEGKLRESRMKNAKQLMEMAQRIKEMPQEQKEAHAGAGGGEAEESEGETWMLAERPKTRFDDIAGLDDVKTAIQMRMILPVLHPDKAERFKVTLGGGVLLYGPPGTGKTMLARAVAGEIDAPFFTVSPADILSRWVGDAEKNIDKLFTAARRHPLAVIFIDEIEAMLPRRDAVESPVMQRLVPQILAELEGIDKDKQNPLLFIGATNKPWTLDEAVLRPGRFDEKVYVPLPDPEARQAILYHHLGEMPLDPDVDYDWLVEVTAGYSGADIVGLVRKVSGDVFRKAIEVDEEMFLTRADFEDVLASWNSSVPPGSLERYDRFARGEWD